MTGWRMRPTASVLGVIAIIPVMITVTALEAESGAIERGNNHLDAEERRFDETIETRNRTVEHGWPRDNVTALEEIVPAFAATNQDDVARLDKHQFGDRVLGSRALASGQAKSIEVTPDEGTVAECTTAKDSPSFVTVAETRYDNASRRYPDNQMIFASRRIEDSEQAKEAQSFPEREDVRGTNETTIEMSRDDWLTTSTEEEEEDEEEREEEQEEQQEEEEEEEEEEDDEDEENENVMRTRYGEQRNVEDIRAISFHVPPPPPPRDTDGRYQDRQVQSGTSGETRKNQSNRAANNLLLTGKSTKAFYEIKPSSKTLEMERGYEQQNHATTHRTPQGRKFILPSVDSAYGKFGPYFEDGDHELNITARIGSTVLLDCKIGMLGDKKVTWLQHNEDSFRLLTVGRAQYSLDQRISLNFRYPSNWRLQILYASPHDSGLYQCQVATHPPLDKKINVVVTAPVLTISDDSGRIVSKERHLKAGSVLRLRCEARDVLESLNESVVWTRGDETLTEDVSENRTTEISAGKEVLVIVSTLIVERASPRHAGNYSCMVPGKAKTTVAVHVLNGELPAAVHDGNGVSRAFLNLWLVHLTMSYVFTR